MIIDAYCRIRTIDQTIPDDVLDFMKDCAIEKIRSFPVKTFTEDPFIDEVVGERLLNKIKQAFHNKGMKWTPKTRVSDCAFLLPDFGKMRGVGTKIRHEFEEVINKYK